MKNHLVHSCVLIFLFQLFYATTAYSQDLIQDGVRPINSAARLTEPNHLAEMLEINSQQYATKRFQPFRVNQTINAREHEAFVEGAVYLTLDKTATTRLIASKPRVIHLQLPISEKRHIELELFKYDVLQDDFTATTSSGQIWSKEDLDIITYRGIVKGDPTSLVALTVYKDKIQGLIADKRGNYELGSLKNQPTNYILYSTSRLKKRRTGTCGVDLEDRFSKYLDLSIPSSTGQGRSVTNPCVSVHVETDYKMFQDLGDFNGVLNRTVEIFNVVATLYLNEGITIGLSQVNVINQSADDIYASTTDAFEVLDRFANKKQNNFNGQLAHLFSTRTWDDGVLGTAYINTLCAQYTAFDKVGPFGINSLKNDYMPFPNFSDDVTTVAHELGHNFGALHTHGCYWNGDGSQIDDCGNMGQSEPEGQGCFDANNPKIPSAGTIMSYCSNYNFSEGFSEEPASLMRNRVNNQSCLLQCGFPQKLEIDAPIAGTITAQNSVTTKGNVALNATTSFGAYDFITLNSGFQVMPNTAFTAQLVGCTFSTEPAFQGGTGSCAAPIAISCGETKSGNVVTGSNAFQAYNCADFDFSGNELVYRFTINTTTDVTATLTNVAPGPISKDPTLMDVFIMSACSNGACLAAEGNEGSNNFVSITNLAAGTYYIVVDDATTRGELSTFNLTLTCSTALNASNPLAKYTSAAQDQQATFSTFPNPLKGQANITMLLPKAAKVDLVLYDLHGKKVKTLLSQVLLDEGSHTLNWRTDQLAKGFYFLNLAYNDTQLYEKIVIME